jgi:hypothetical protein
MKGMSPGEIQNRGMILFAYFAESTASVKILTAAPSPALVVLSDHVKKEKVFPAS